MAKKIDELERPKIPGYIDMSKVNSAAGNIAAARDAINNLNYDTFKQGTQYGNLKKSYEQQGQAAMKDTLGQVAARTGGMASSYATSAANQSYNNYMQTLEDAARSMFNEEYARKKDAYNMAQQEYNNEWNRYQNEYSQAWDKYKVENSNFENDRTFNTTQADKKKQDEIDMISSDAYYGRSVSWEEYFAAHPDTQLTQNEYESIVAAGEGERTDDNRTNVDNELMSILSDEDFNWDTDYESIAGLIANSSYGMDYWRQYAADKQQGYAEGNKTDAQELAKDMWAAGLTPTDEQLVAAGYMTKTTDANGNDVYTWTDEGLAAMYLGTGLSDTELEQLFGTEGFNWDTYDFDKDGKVGEEDTDGEDMSGFFANSSFGEDYWRQFAADKQQVYAEGNKTDAQGRVADAWDAGDDPNEKDLIDAGYIEVDKDGKAIMENGDYKYTTAGKDALANSSALGKMDMEYLLTSGKWTWGDWDRDGEVEGDNEDVTAKQFFSKSGGSEEAWKAWFDDYNQAEKDKTTKESQTANTNEIDAMLKNGASLEDIEKEFGIGPDGETWESVTGMSKAEWKAKQTGYRQGSYKFPNTSAGRSDIMDILIESDNLTLSPTDADNFDYLYGDGAYDAIQKFSDNILSIQYGNDPEDDKDRYFAAYSWAKKVSPYLSDDILDRIVQTINPELWDFMFPSK